MADNRKKPGAFRPVSALAALASLLALAHSTSAETTSCAGPDAARLSIEERVGRIRQSLAAFERPGDVVSLPDDAEPPHRVLQWPNWPNWPNWSNWNNWRNWNNWVNWWNG